MMMMMNSVRGDFDLIQIIGTNLILLRFIFRQARKSPFDFLKVFPVDLPVEECGQKSAECGEQHGNQMWDVIQTAPFFRIFSSG